MQYDAYECDSQLYLNELFKTCTYTYPLYCLSKKSWPILYSKLLCKLCLLGLLGHTVLRLFLGTKLLFQSFCQSVTLLNLLTIQKHSKLASIMFFLRKNIYLLFLLAVYSVWNYKFILYVQEVLTHFFSDLLLKMGLDSLDLLYVQEVVTPFI